MLFSGVYETGSSIVSADYRGPTADGSRRRASSRWPACAVLFVSGWLTSTVLRSFRASFAGVSLNSVSLVFIVAGGLIFVAGIRAFAALPSVSVSSAR